MIRRARASFALVFAAGVAASVLAAACGMTRDDAPAPADASTDDVSDATSSASDAADGAVPSAPTCLPEAAPPRPPAPPPPRHESACPTAGAIQLVLNCAFGDPHASPAECASARDTADFIACQQCIFGRGFGELDAGADADRDAGTSAPPIVVQDGLAHLDVAACLELRGDGGAAICIDRYRAGAACEFGACASCAAAGKASYDDCRLRAHATTCASVEPPRECGIEAAAVGCEVGADFLGAAVKYGIFFCLADGSGG